MRIVEQLRRGSYKVRVTHKRLYATDEFHCQILEMSKYELNNLIVNHPLGFILLERGGSTLVDITAPDGRTATGVAECSIDDNFNRKEGLKLAIKRALKNLSAKVNIG